MTSALLTPTTRRADGKQARVRAPLDSHSVVDSTAPRDPVGLLLQQAESRDPELVPIRHGRMMVSPFTYYRGAALQMAADLAAVPDSGIRVQLCGDAHLANFGAFASPERRLVFDVNDFDETLPGPFEWDVKRLAASLAVAGRDNGYSTAERRTIVLDGVRTYRRTIRRFAKTSMLEVWYARLDVEDAAKQLRSQLAQQQVKRTEKVIAKARTRDSLHALAKLTTVVDGRRSIVSEPPLIVPVEQLYGDVRADTIYEQLNELILSYGHTLQSDRRHLLHQFSLVQVARKVVGVGSVGTRAWILLLESADGDPLFLQAKEAQDSVLAGYAGRSEYDNQGERVVAGQHLMQAVSDIFLGWERVTGLDDRKRDFYLRQLRDWKMSLPIEQMIPSGMAVYARLCGWTLARAHARSGDRVALASYLGKSDTFDRAIADFAESYADLNENDHAALVAAVADGRAQAVQGI